MSGRVSLLAAIAVSALGLLGCGQAPAAPSPKSASSLPIVSLRLAGPESLAPPGRGVSVGQFVATATRSDGTTSDVTASASFTSSAFAVVNPTNVRPGEMQAVRRGEAIVSAGIDGVSSTALVLVLEAGTFKVSGKVTESETGGGLRSVQIRIESGPQQGLTTTTDNLGRYALYGAAGPIELSASTEGYRREVHPRTVTGSAIDDFVLSPIAPTPNISGVWTLSISASPGCRQQLPEIARDRQYDATIASQGPRVKFTISGPTVETNYDDAVPKGVFQDEGTILGGTLTLTITGDTGYGDHTSVIFVDHLSPDQSLGIAASARGTVTGAEIRMTMEGDIEYWIGPQAFGQPSVVCRATDHVAILRRR